jgi:hypothetical protein
MSKRTREETHIEYFDILEDESPFKKMKKEGSFLFTNLKKRLREECPEDLVEYESPLKKQKMLLGENNLIISNLTTQMHCVTL